MSQIASLRAHLQGVTDVRVSQIASLRAHLHGVRKLGGEFGDIIANTPAMRHSETGEFDDVMSRSSALCQTYRWVR